MRVALIADIHGNIVALEAALAAIEREGVDRIVCLGDVAATGPRPREVIARLRALGCPCVMGNADAELLDPDPAEAPNENARMVQEISQWGASLLDEDDKRFLGAFQPSIGVLLESATSLLCFHGSPRSFNEILLAATPDDRLAEVFADHPADVYAGGHTHIQLVRRVGRALLINPGSIGLPVDTIPLGADARNPARAEYALLTVENGVTGITLRREKYDLAALVESVRGSGMPHADAYLADWVAG